MRWISLIAVLLCLGQTETVQFFGGTEGCYGNGMVFVMREAVNECDHGDGGWGDVLMECYTDGELYHRCGVVIEMTCCSADLDHDGDVDLADFAEFQREMDR